MPETLIRVGHKGADLIAPGNTRESYDAALACGVHMIEFDVMPADDGTLVLAHDPEDARSRTPLTLEEGLDHLAGRAFAGIEFDVDLKARGYENAVVDAMGERGMLDRALFSSHYLESLAAVGERAPGARRGISVPNVRRDYTKSPLLAVPAYAGLLVMKTLLPARMATLIRDGRCEAVMVFRLLVTSTLMRTVHDAGGRVYVWTVDDADEIARLFDLGADGVITNDPRLFDTIGGAD